MPERINEKLPERKPERMPDINQLNNNDGKLYNLLNSFQFNQTNSNDNIEILKNELLKNFIHNKASPIFNISNNFSTINYGKPEEGNNTNNNAGNSKSGVSLDKNKLTGVKNELFSNKLATNNSNNLSNNLGGNNLNSNLNSNLNNNLNNNNLNNYDPNYISMEYPKLLLFQNQLLNRIPNINTTTNPINPNNTSQPIQNQNTSNLSNSAFHPYIHNGLFLPNNYLSNSFHPQNYIYPDNKQNFLNNNQSSSDNNQNNMDHYFNEYFINQINYEYMMNKMNDNSNANNYPSYFNNTNNINNNSKNLTNEDLYLNNNNNNISSSINNNNNNNSNNYNNNNNNDEYNFNQQKQQDPFLFKPIVTKNNGDTEVKNNSNLNNINNINSNNNNNNTSINSQMNFNTNNSNPTISDNNFFYDENITVFKKKDNVKTYGKHLSKTNQDNQDHLSETRVNNSKPNVSEAPKNKEDNLCLLFFKNSKQEINSSTNLSLLDQNDLKAKEKSKKLMNNFDDFLHFNDIELPIECREKCSKYLSCPELLPLNCQTFQQNECTCINFCKKKAQLFQTILNRCNY